MIDACGLAVMQPWQLTPAGSLARLNKLRVLLQRWASTTLATAMSVLYTWKTYEAINLEELAVCYNLP